MYNIGVIGDYDSICGFSAIGFNIFPIENVDQAKERLKTLANDGYGIIYITEPVMQELQAECEIYNEKQTLCIIPIPTSSGAIGFGETRLRACVEKAVGSDIIFGND